MKLKVQLFITSLYVAKLRQFNNYKWFKLIKYELWNILIELNNAEVD